MRTTTIIVVVLAIAMLIASRHSLPLLSAYNIDSIISNVAAKWWGPLVVIALYLVGGFVAFPVTVLIVATALTFGPLFGSLYSGLGLMASAAVIFIVGKLIGRDAVPERWRERFAILGSHGLIVVAIMRVAGIPFSIGSLIAGASGIRVLDYLAGTFVGILPGLLVLSALGHQFHRSIVEPKFTEIAGLVALIAVWLFVTISLQRFISSRRRARAGDSAFRRNNGSSSM